MKSISFQNDVLPLKDKLYRLALRITLDTAEAEDIVQDTLIRIWNKREELSQLESIEAYSLTICRNLALDRSNKKEAQNLPLEAAPLTPDINASPSERLVNEERLAWVHRLFCKLPEKQRSVMQLRDIEGKSYKEIATILNMTEDQVKVNLFRARQSIRNHFEKIDNYGL